MLSEEEKFRFDLQGYLVVRNVLSKTECSALAELSDGVWPRQTTDSAFRRTPGASASGARIPGT